MGKAAKSVKSAGAVDNRIGQKIRLRRNELKMSQENLGYALGVSFQQIQKYESGTNRVSASRLEKVAAVLDLPVSHFYDPRDAKQAEVDSLLCLDPKFSLRLLRAYYKIADKGVAHQLVLLIEGIAG